MMHWVDWLHWGEAIDAKVSSTIPAGGGGGEAGTGEANAICCWVSLRPYGMAGMVRVIWAIWSCFSISVANTGTDGCAR